MNNQDAARDVPSVQPVARQVQEVLALIGELEALTDRPENATAAVLRRSSQMLRALLSDWRTKTLTPDHVAGLTRSDLWTLASKQRDEVNRCADLGNEYGELATYMVDHYLDRVDQMSREHVSRVLRGERP